MPDTELRDALLDIGGIGEATADKILDTVEEHYDAGTSLDTDALLAAIPPGKGRSAAQEYLRDQ